MALASPLRSRECRTCGSTFSPWSTTQTVCSPTCASKFVRTAKKTEKAEHRAKLKASRETIPKLIAAAQIEFNAYRRLCDRIAGYPCISCSRPLDWGTAGNSHQVDCGHYRSTGAASHLRFDERNAHAQCVNCNRYGAGMAVEYRINLIKRIGLDAVEALEADNEPVKWDRDTLRQIKTIYRAKARALKATF